MLYLVRMIQHIYKCGAPLGGKYILQHCIGLNIPEPLGLLLAGESVEEFDWI
jgi:hypothetical protein